jgi:hypothetical protein
MTNLKRALFLLFFVLTIVFSAGIFQVQAGGTGEEPTDIITTTQLDAISEPLVVGQTNVYFHGTVSSNNFGYPVQSGTAVTLFYSSSFSGPFTQCGIGATTSDTLPNMMAFSGTFNVPTGIAPGTYYFQANYVGGSVFGVKLNPSSSNSVSGDNVHVNIVPAAGQLPEYTFAALGALGACFAGFAVIKARGKIANR